MKSNPHDREGSFIAYAVQRFPALRTTFIRREVEALRQLGLPIEVFSMRPADREELRDEKEAVQHLRTTHYLPSRPLGFTSLAANLAALARKPAKSLANWRLALASPGAAGVARRARLALQVWRGAVMAARIRRLGRCRHVHANFADGAATTALTAARLLGVPFSFTSHTSFDAPALAEKLRQMAFVASISQYDRRRLIDLGGAEVADRIHVVHCGIPLEQWPFSPRAEMHHPARILSVGALIEKKGHDVLIRACGLLKERGIAFRCKIVGDGPLRASLDRLIDELDTGDVVELVGPLPQEQVRKELYASDVFALACKRAPNGDTDGLPVSLMEAMAAGVAVVSCRIAGVPELIEDGLSGYLAHPDDAGSLREALEKCLTAGEQREEFTRQARGRIEERFHQKREAEKLARLLLGASERASGQRLSAAPAGLEFPLFQN